MSSTALCGSTSQTLLAIDPGETTGYALFQYGHDRSRPPTLLQSGQCLLWGPIPYIIVTVDRIVIERFLLLPGVALAQTGSEFPAVQVLGVVRFLAETHQIPMVVQNPLGNVNTFFSDRRLRECGYVPKGPLSARRHACDAIRHGLQYLHFSEGFAYKEGNLHAVPGALPE